MESVLLKKLDWKLLVPELAMVLIRSQLLSMDYDPETQEYSFKKREVGKKKQTCKVTKATKTIVIQNFHSRSNRKAITGPGQTRAEKPEEDTCAAWSYFCCCEVLRKAFKKQECGRKDKHSMQGVLQVYATQVVIVRTVISTQITTRTRVIPSPNRPQSQNAPTNKERSPSHKRQNSISSVDSRIF